MFQESIFASAFFFPFFFFKSLYFFISILMYVINTLFVVCLRKLWSKILKIIHSCLIMLFPNFLFCIILLIHLLSVYKKTFEERSDNPEEQAHAMNFFMENSLFLFPNVALMVLITSHCFCFLNLSKSYAIFLSLLFFPVFL